MVGHRALLAALGLIALQTPVAAGAQLTSDSSLDGYAYKHPTLNRDVVEITLVRLGSTAAVREEALKYDPSLAKDKRLTAFAVVSKSTAKCTVYIINPKIRFDPSGLGHEVMHCFAGAYHSE